jgi:hypothetical protein
MSSRKIFDLASTSPDPYSAADGYQAKLHPNMMLLVVKRTVLIGSYKEK